MSTVDLRVSGSPNADEITLIHKWLRMYARYAELQGWEMRPKTPHESCEGPSNVLAEIRGENVYNKLKYEDGVHRIQWVPPAERQGRVHTSRLFVVVVREVGDPRGIRSSAGDGPIRTYSFPLGRVTDHRLGLTFYELDHILDGRLDPIVEALAEHEGRDPDA